MAELVECLYFEQRLLLGIEVRHLVKQDKTSWLGQHAVLLAEVDEGVDLVGLQVVDDARSVRHKARLHEVFELAVGAVFVKLKVLLVRIVCVAQSLLHCRRLLIWILSPMSALLPRLILFALALSIVGLHDAHLLPLVQKRRLVPMEVV